MGGHFNATNDFIDTFEVSHKKSWANHIRVLSSYDKSIWIWILNATLQTFGIDEKYTSIQEKDH